MGVSVTRLIINHDIFISHFNCRSFQRVQGGGISSVNWSASGNRLFVSHINALCRVWETTQWTCEKWTNLAGRCKARWCLLLFCLSIYLSIYLSICLSVCLSILPLSFCVCARMYICVCTCMYVYLFTHYIIKFVHLRHPVGVPTDSI